MSSFEFLQWQAWLDAEHMGPAYDRLRHAQALAATLNAGRFGKADGKAFTPSDFLVVDPWAPPKVETAPTFEQIQAQAALMYQGG